MACIRSAVYSGGDWYGYSYGYTYDRQYDTDFVTVSTKLFDVSNEEPIWSYISQVRVQDSRERAINLLIPTIVEQLEASDLVDSKRP